MPIHLICLVLFAALLHASWNALLRSGADRLWSMTVMCIAIAMVCMVAAAFMVPPAIESWGYALLSGLLHVGYNLFLVRSYRVGDLGQIYPISRGSSPVLITLGAAVFAGESISPGELLGVALVSGGIISLAFKGRNLSVPSLPYALGTGCFIAAYSVVDGIGARLSGAPLAYTVWMCVLWGVLMPLVYIGLRGPRSLFTVRPGTVTAVVGGLVSLLAYAMVIYAMNEAPLGAVSALRETSVLFALLIGYVFLGETLTARRILACVVIASGAVIIG
ncbi:MULTISPECIES: DMT family transporter [Pseudomonas]|uniref:DMT family transporter n=1 Tax=Pseudomonas TaxID=286 RepID=UPI000CFD3053|nr:MULTISPECIES: DMT family transporter [Pseudomonas]PQZ93196.1 EamA family transporter [Pseudomonas trivialis]PRB28517.1 EamA family transporter [Pseudomonas sp. MYb60]